MPSQEDKKKLNSIKQARIATIVLAAILVVLLVVALAFSLNVKRPLQRYTPGEYSPGYINDANKISAQEKQAIDEHNAIGNLLDKLPYKGKNFSIDFDHKIVKYVVVISQKNKAQGDQEFDEFLKSNGISSRNSFINLDVQYK